MKRIVIDLDNTLCESNGDYASALPKQEVISKLKQYKDLGFEIVIHSSRNMKTFSNQVGLINVHTLPTILDWLEKNDVPYDELIVGKPWCGSQGFYVDDRSIRPDEFVSLSFDEIKCLVDRVDAL